MCNSDVRASVRSSLRIKGVIVDINDEVNYLVHGSGPGLGFGVP